MHFMYVLDQDAFFIHEWIAHNKGEKDQFHVCSLRANLSLVE